MRPAARLGTGVFPVTVATIKLGVWKFARFRDLGLELEVETFSNCGVTRGATARGPKMCQVWWDQIGPREPGPDEISSEGVGTAAEIALDDFVCYAQRELDHPAPSARISVSTAGSNGEK